MQMPIDAARPAKPVVLIASSGAGHADGGIDLASLLAAEHVRVAERLDVAALDARESLDQGWRRAGIQAIVAAGGDGTIGSVATHLAGSGLPLGILPMGTSNDTARSLGVPLDLAEAARAIASGVVAEVDMGQMVPTVTVPGVLAARPSRRHTRSATAERAGLRRAGACFLHAATLGLNVEFARLATDIARREHWGALNYASAAVESLAHMQPIPVVLELHDGRARAAFERAPMPAPAQVFERIECHVVQLAIVNTPVFGGGLNLEMPGVHLHDRLLDVLIIEALEPRHLRETLDGLLAALGRLKDRLVSGDATPAEKLDDDAAAGPLLPGVRRYQVRSLRITTPSPLDMTLDGEIRGQTPLEIRVAPDPLRVLLPLAAREALRADTEVAEASGG